MRLWGLSGREEQRVWCALQMQQLQLQLQRGYGPEHEDNDFPGAGASTCSLSCAPVCPWKKSCTTMYNTRMCALLALQVCSTTTTTASCTLHCMIEMFVLKLKSST